MKLIGFILLAFSLNAFGKIKLTTFNVENYHSFLGTNEALLFKAIESQNADLIAVQEIVDATGFKSFITKKFPNYRVILSSCGGGGNQKLGFVYDKRVLKLEELEFDRRFEDVKEGKCGSLRPAVIGRFRHYKERKIYTAIVVHLKAGSNDSSMRKRRTQFKYLADLANRCVARGDKNIVIMGDFNTTGFIARNTDYEYFSDLLNKIDGTTNSENLNCTSYWEGEDHTDDLQEPSILDHIVVVGDLQSRVTNREVGGHCKKARCNRASSRELGDFYKQVSDHCPVGVTIE